MTLEFTGERQVSPTLDGINSCADKITRYFTGVPCIRGHIADRFVSSRRCIECAKEDLVTWRDKNSERERKKAVERVRVWRKENPVRSAESMRRYQVENREKIALRKQAYYKEHREIISVLNASRPKNRASANERSRKWRESNPVAKAASSRNYRARIRSANGSHTKEDIEFIISSQEGRCAYCYIDLGDTYHIDHMTPLYRGGSNWPDNLCATCPTCNVSKGTKTAEEFRSYLRRAS